MILDSEEKRARRETESVSYTHLDVYKRQILAVLTLYYMVGHWNQYFNALIYLTKEELFPLQLFLRNILIVDQSAEMLSSDPEALNDFVYRLRLKQSMQYGLVVVSTLPMLILYPFMQKFFTKGIMLGAIKG